VLQVKLSRAHRAARSSRASPRHTGLDAYFAVDVRRCNFFTSLLDVGIYWTRSATEKGLPSPKNGLSHLAWQSAHPADFHFPHSLGCYWDMNGSLSDDNDRKTHNSTSPEINLLQSKNGLAGCGKTRFEGDAVPRNSLVSTAQPDKKKVCVEKTSSSWMCLAT
jgi:hypothetical protein